MGLKIISAGAGSGKTYSLTEKLTALLTPSATDGKAQVRAAGIVATTFTNKAAAELKERVRVKLLQSGLTQEADALGSALIGTVHSIGGQLLSRFAFEAGVSPEVEIMADEDGDFWFNQSLAEVLTLERVREMDELSNHLGFAKDERSRTDWRRIVHDIMDSARSNAMSSERIEFSKQQSLDSFFSLFPKAIEKNWEEELRILLEETLERLYKSEDSTKKKDSLIKTLRDALHELNLYGYLHWYQWAGLAKADPPAKCRADVAELLEFAAGHGAHPKFHKDMRSFIALAFEIAESALEAYDKFKKQRGWIDYIDMEVKIIELLENPVVREILTDEIDLLLVDEFQDTNPTQLQIFLQLSKIAKQAIWVGDPKQSIYAFRGADPELMLAMMEAMHQDDIEVLEKSWRSRQDLVNTANAIFAKAFLEANNMPEERVALQMPEQHTKSKEAADLLPAVQHWHFVCSENPEKKKINESWNTSALAYSVRELLQSDCKVRLKGKSDQTRPIKAGDVAILCRNNSRCQAVAQALAKMGIKASIAQSALLETTEITLVLACLKYILNEYDSLAIAEILRLAESLSLEEIIIDRLRHLQKMQTEEEKISWGEQYPYIKKLRVLRRQVRELSAREVLDLLIERLDMWRIVAAWGNEKQRHANIDALRGYAMRYEESCNRIHSAATLGGFLLWLDKLALEGNDAQGKGVSDDAVNIITYHSSKGLEWAFVICYDLNNDLKDNPLGVRIERSSKQVDIENPLKDRYICYWLNPYASQYKGTEFWNKVQTHESFFRYQKQQREEEIRLLYVGITRARDYIVFPTYQTTVSTGWLSRVFHNGASDIPLFDTHSEFCPWVWKGEEIPLLRRQFDLPLVLELPEIEPVPIFYWEPKAEEKNHPSVVAETPFDLFPNTKSKQHKVFDLDKGLPEIPENMSDEESLHLSGIASLVLGTQHQASLTDVEARCDAFIQKYNWGAWLNKTDLSTYIFDFYKNIKNRLPIRSLHRGLPFVCRNPMLFRGVADLVLESTNQQELWIIQSAPFFIADPHRRRHRIKEIGLFLEAAKSALKLQYPYISTFKLLVFLPMEGALVEIENHLQQSNTMAF